MNSCKVIVVHWRNSRFDILFFISALLYRLLNDYSSYYQKYKNLEVLIMNNFLLLVLGFLLFFVSIAQAVSNSTVAAAMARNKIEKATFAGGCFWCMEKPFEQLDGVL